MTIVPLNITNLITKASSLTIKHAYTTKKGTRHYTLIFKHIPYYTKDHKFLYSEMIFPDCTFDQSILTTLISNKETKALSNMYIIYNLYSFIINNQLMFQHHPSPSTTQLITIQIPKEN